MSNPINVLLVEDSIPDARLVIEIFRDQNIGVDIHVVRDGEEAMSYLRMQPPHQQMPNPDLILLDLNLPKKDGREVLADIKSDSNLRGIPVIILTTSSAEEDIVRSYKLQASCYVTKPIDLNEFVETVRSIDRFWFTAVRFPQPNGK